MEKEKLTKILVQGIVLFKKLREQKEKEIDEINYYLNEISSLVDEEKDTEQPIAYSVETPIKMPVKDTDTMGDTMEEIAPSDIIQDTDESPSSDKAIIHVAPSIMGETKPEKYKIYCAVCNKYHTKGTHD